MAVPSNAYSHSTDREKVVSRKGVSTGVHETNCTNHKHDHSQRLFSASTPPDLDSLPSFCARTTSPSDYPLAPEISSKIPIYDLAHPASINDLQDEWYAALLTGPGVIVLRDFLPSPLTITNTNTVFDSIIADEAAGAPKKGDHFASAGKTPESGTRYPNTVSFTLHPLWSITATPGYTASALLTSAQPTE